MLEAHGPVSDLNFSVGHPPQVELHGELLPVVTDPPLPSLTPYQTEAIALALMGNPHLFLLDEPFEGLAPPVVGGVWKALAEIRGSTTLLLVEQHADLALALGDRAFVITMARSSIPAPARRCSAISTCG